LATAGARGLTGDAKETLEGIIGLLSWDTVLLDFQHLLPHVLGASLAVLNVTLDISVQDLDVVEDHWEGDETRGHGHGRKDHGGESGRLHAAFLLHLFVLDHRGIVGYVGSRETDCQSSEL
jgi:hypothetical protein